VASLGGLLRFLETVQVHKFSSTQCTSLLAELHAPCTLRNYFCECYVRPTGGYWWKPVTQFSAYAIVDTTNVLSSYFMTVDMHRIALMWPVYSRNKFFSVSNVSEKVGPRGNQF